jgi:hypothetical protein
LLRAYFKRIGHSSEAELPQRAIEFFRGHAGMPFFVAVLKWMT